jgi:hypothetical protein
LEMFSVKLKLMGGGYLYNKRKEIFTIGVHMFRDSQCSEMSTSKRRAFWNFEKLARGGSNKVRVGYGIHTAKKVRFMYSEKSKCPASVPNFYIHISVSDLYVPTIGLSK